MNKILHSYITALLLFGGLLLSGCYQDTLDGCPTDEGGTVPVSLSVSLTRAAGDDEAEADAENLLKTLRVYAFYGDECIGPLLRYPPTGH